MDIRQLTIFLKVCEIGSFTGTAKALNYAQSSVSEAIQSMEIILGVKLFERLGHKIYLTKAGESLKPFAENLIEIHNQMMVYFDQNTMKTIRVGITETLCAYRFPSFFRKYISDNPQISIYFEIARCEEIPILIRNNTIDIGFTLDEILEYKDIKTINLFQEEIIFVHGGPTVKFASLEGEKVIISKGKTGYNKLFYEICEKEELTIGAQIFMESIEGIKSYVKDGFGFSFMPKTTVKKELEDGSIVCSNPKGKHYFHEVKILIHKDKHMDKELEKLVDAAQLFYGEE